MADAIQHLAETQIQEALDEGKFDNLPGSGKPLVFNEDPSVPLHVRITNRVLDNAGIAPEWVEARREIIEERKTVQALFEQCCRENQARNERLQGLLEQRGPQREALAYRQVFAEWHSNKRSKYLHHLKSVNNSILKFCMSAPSTSQPFSPYNVPEEMRNFDTAIPAPETMTIELQVEAVSPRRSSLQSTARALYQRLSQSHSRNNRS